MSSRGAEPHDHEPARQPTLAAYAPEPVLPPAASAPDWRSRQGRWVDRSLSGRHHLPWCRGLFRPVAKSNPCTIPRSKRQRPSYRSRPHTPNLWTVPSAHRPELVNIEQSGSHSAVSSFCETDPRQENPIQEPLQYGWKSLIPNGTDQNKCMRGEQP